MTKIGLTGEEAAQSLKKYGNNALSKPPQQTFFNKLLDNFQDPIIRILIVALLINMGFVYLGYADWIEKLSKTIRCMEMNAENVYDEVAKHMESPQAVVAALGSKTSLNPDVIGYFAAFVPNYFPQEGRWFQPYVHQGDSTEFVLTRRAQGRQQRRARLLPKTAQRRGQKVTKITS